MQSIEEANRLPAVILPIIKSHYWIRWRILARRQCCIEELPPQPERRVGASSPLPTRIGCSCKEPGTPVGRCRFATSWNCGQPLCDVGNKSLGQRSFNSSSLCLTAFEWALSRYTCSIVG
ncbi:hypothetical protein LIA77_09009 [Sarocladium implicatum]|nr:hypothetical protein LIA77_09009 [Sarocladium implicatum]